MAISFISNALGATNSTTSFSITLPDTAAGDIIILEFTHRGTGDGTIGGTYTGPAFTLKHSQLYASSAFSGKTYYSRATGNHAGETVTGSGLTNSCAAIVTVYRGALASGDPLADATVVGEENASGNETQAQITTATNGAYVVLVVVNSPDLAVSTQACTSPGTLPERAERLSTGGTDTSIAHASEAKATAGGTGAFTWAQTNAASGSWAYAIKPSSDVSLAISGNAATSAIGALAVAVVIALSSVFATGSIGSITPTLTRELTGIASTASVGTAIPNCSIALTGTVATEAIGIISPSVSFPLTGLTGTGAVGTVVYSAEEGLTLALTGNVGTSGIGTMTLAASIALTGASGIDGIGTVVPNASVIITGEAGTGSAGTAVLSIVAAPTGVVATGNVGTIVRSFLITGTTKDKDGVALPSCTVRLFATSTNVLAQSMTSDGSGFYSFTVTDPAIQHYVVAYKAGNPDVAGTTKNDLIGA